MTTVLNRTGVRIVATSRTYEDGRGTAYSSEVIIQDGESAIVQARSFGDDGHMVTKGALYCVFADQLEADTPNGLPIQPIFHSAPTEIQLPNEVTLIIRPAYVSQSAEVKQWWRNHADEVGTAVVIPEPTVSE